MLRLFPFAIVLWIAGSSSAFAGLYLSTEAFAELPSQMRGFLLDQRALRLIAVPAAEGMPATFLREQYQDAADKLDKLALVRELKANEIADLGAIRIRLGQSAKAVEVLRAGVRRFPRDFSIAANLGSAWQANGDLAEAVQALQDALRIAPEAHKHKEELHSRLLRLRLKEGKSPTGFDDLFGIAFTDAMGKIAPGKIDPEQRKKLPADAVAMVQQLALWMPTDGRLLWLLGELVNAHGDVRTAAAILDGCVGDFGLAAGDIRKRRQVYRDAADEIAKLPDTEHAKFRGDLVTKSSRPLIRKLDSSLLPAIRDDGVNPLPWLVVSETVLDKKFRPTFSKYLTELKGKSISITGFMQPIGDEVESGQFLLVEFPVGCWFCESPDATGIIRVQLPKGKAIAYRRGIVKVAGVLSLNATEPEDFLFTIGEAKVSEPD